VPATSQTAWTPKQLNSGCDDGDLCTIADVCQPDGTCRGTVFKDEDADTYTDAACPGGTDCNDNDNQVKPGVNDPIEGIRTVVETTDPGGTHGQWVSVAFDALGRAHAAWYNGDTKDLEYATNRDGLWATATVDEPGETATDVGLYASLVVAPLGAVDIAYYDATRRVLKHATNSSGLWETVIVTGDTAHDCGSHASLARAPDGHLHVVYYNATAGDLVYRHQPRGGAWSAAETIDSAGNVGEHASLAMDAAGVLHVAYQNATNQDLRYATNRSGTWTFQDVDAPASGNLGARTALALDDDGRPHILYADATADDVKHAWLDDNTWRKVVAFNGTGAHQPEQHRMGLTLRPDGSLWGCYVRMAAGDPSNYRSVLIQNDTVHWDRTGDYTTTQLGDTAVRNSSCAVATAPDASRHVFWHAGNTGNALKVETSLARPGFQVVDGTDSVGSHASMARAADGTLHVSYRSDTATALRYAVKEVGKAWRSEEVDNAADVGRWTSLALDSAGVVHITYQDVTASDLKYVRGNRGAWGQPELVESAGVTGLYSSLVLAAGDVPHVAFYSGTSLKVARKEGGAWSVETVAASVGQYPALKQGTDGTFHLAYRGAGGNTLYYVRGRPGAWEGPQDVLVSGNVGHWNSLVLDPHNNPHIATYGATGVEVRHAYSMAGGSPGTWAQEMVDPAGGTHTSTALDAAGRLFISYVAGNQLRLAVKESSGWVTTVVDSVNSAFTSLVVEPGGTWHVAYQSTADNDLRYASPVVPAWSGTPTVVSRSGRGGEYPSVAIDPSGTVHVAYRDIDNNALRYARRLEGVWYRSELDATAGAGEYTDIAVEDDGTAHVAYRNGSVGSLVYGVVRDGEFRSVVVDSTNAGTYASLGLDSEGDAHVAYYDNSARDLFYAKGNLAAFGTPVPLATTGDVGSYAALAVDSANVVHLAFRDATNADLKYAHNGTGTFSVVTVESGASNYGNYAALAVDRSRVAHLVHKDTTANDLRYSSNALGIFSSAAVDTANVGSYARIALDGVGNAYVAYKNDQTNVAKIAVDVSGTWQTFQVEPGATPNRVSFLDLAVGPDRRVYMPCWDTDDRVLLTAVVEIRNQVDQNCDGY
jgi:hypothetical protein